MLVATRQKRLYTNAAFFHKDLKDDMEANHIFYAIQRSTVYVIKFMLNTMLSGDIKSGMSVEWEKEGT
jgi:argininosuccinate synthase